MIKLYRDGRDFAIGIDNVKTEQEFVDQFSRAFCGADATHDPQTAQSLLQGFLPHAADAICSFRGITKGTGSVRKVTSIIAGNMPAGAPIHTHMSEADEEEATSPDPQPAETE
jgi:hypothetical protein